MLILSVVEFFSWKIDCRVPASCYLEILQSRMFWGSGVRRKF